MTTRLTRVGIAVAALATVSALPAAGERDLPQERLMVTGLPANRTFGAHVHTAPCGTDPSASGGHYQHSTGASQPLADRELWLDVTTDAQGRGTTTTTVPWTFAPGTAGSVVIHANPTNPTTGAPAPG